MRAGQRGVGAAALLIGLTLPAVPAHAAEQTALTGAAAPVSLVVGLRTGTDPDAPVDRLETRTGVDVIGTDVFADDSALTVDVPAGDVAEAADALRGDPAVSWVEVDQIARMAAVPNDPAYPQQWSLRVAEVARAWSTTHGAAQVVIAVVDTGVKPIPDLAPRLLSGYDFVNRDRVATDDQGHGTMTASVLGATGNNGVGVAGICWSCRILPVKVLGKDGSGLYSDIADGIRYSANQGADIINLSLSGAVDSAALRAAVTYATGKGALVIAAAGNDGSAVKRYPAAFGDVLAVGASTQAGGRYSWSNHGASWVDIAAPGCNAAQALTGAPRLFCGTSSAAPFVAGVAGLLASTSPRPTVAQLRKALIASASPLSGAWVAAGSGRVDAGAAMAALPRLADRTAPVTTMRYPAARSVVRGTITVRAGASDPSGVSKVQLVVNGRVVAADSKPPYVFRWASSSVANSVVALRLRSFDRLGNVGRAARSVTVRN